EGDFAKLDGERVDIDPENAVADDIAQGVAQDIGRVGIFARANFGETGGEVVGGGDEKSTRAAGWIADFEGKESPFFFAVVVRFGKLGVENGDEGRFDQLLDEGGGSVIG